MSFTIPIRIDPAGTDAAIARVTSELERAERTGKAAGEIVSRAIQQGRLSADQAASATAAYARELANAERQAEKLAQTSQKVAQGGLFGGMLQGAGLASLAGGMAGIAAAATAKVLDLARSVVELGESYTNLDNRLRSIAPLEADRLQLMERTRSVANAARADWNATNELFVRLSSSTKEMGISQQRVLGLTETISKTFAMSGASSAEAAAGMLQLSQAFASGKLQGDEFKSLSESVPGVLDLIAKQMGVTRGALKGLSSEGKITGEVLVATFENAKNQIDSGFAQTAPTLSQSWAVFKNDMQATFGPLLQEFLPRVAEALRNIASVVGEVGDAIAKARSIAGTEIAGGTTVGDVAGGAWSALKRGAGTPIMGLASGAGESGEGWASMQLRMQAHADLLAKMEEQEKGWINVLIDEAQVVRDNTLGWGKYQTQLEEFLDTTRVLSGNANFNDQLKQLLITTKEISTPPSDALAGWISNFDRLGDTLTSVGSKADDLVAKLLGVDAKGAELVRGMFGQGGVDLLDKLAEAGSKAEGGWAGTRLDPIELGRQTGRKGGGGGARRAGAKDTWADTYVSGVLVAIDQGIEEIKFRLELFNAWRTRSMFEIAGPGGGGVTSQNLDAARDPAMTAALTGALKKNTSEGKSIDDALRRQQEQFKALQEVGTTAARSIEDAFARLWRTGEFGAKEMFSAIMEDLTRMATHRLLMSLLGAALGPSPVAAAAPAFAHGGSVVPHAAHGDSWRIGGSSTVGDKVPFAAMVNSGERVTITNRFQDAGGRDAGQPRERVVYVNSGRQLTAAQRRDEIVRVALESGFMRRR